jgi:hypothetical protein
MTTTREALRATLAKRMCELKTEIDALHAQHSVHSCGPKRCIAIACDRLEEEINEEIRQMYIETSSSAEIEYSEKEYESIRQIL